MNAKRVKRLRREIEKHGKSWKAVEYEITGHLDKTVVLDRKCGRSHCRNVKKLYRKFGL